MWSYVTQDLPVIVALAVMLWLYFYVRRRIKM